MVYVSAVTGFDHDHRCSLPLVSLVFSEMAGPGYIHVCSFFWP